VTAVEGDQEAIVNVDSEIASVAMARWPFAEPVESTGDVTTLRIRYDDEWRVVQWALSFDDRIEIVSPGALRDRLIAHVEHVA
jgi:predicted DNA-binding transcriptional regulator YafY